MANMSAQIASQGLNGPQATQQAMFGGTGMLGQVGFAGSHQWAMQQAQQLAAQQAMPQIGTPSQIAASIAANQDPNNASASGFSSQSALFPTAQEATGNAPNNTITAGMAIGNAPIATAGNFSPQAQNAAKGIFGSMDQKKLFTKPKALINL